MCGDDDDMPTLFFSDLFFQRETVCCDTTSDDQADIRMFRSDLSSS